MKWGRPVAIHLRMTPWPTDIDDSTRVDRNTENQRSDVGLRYSTATGSRRSSGASSSGPPIHRRTCGHSIAYSAVQCLIDQFRTAPRGAHRDHAGSIDENGDVQRRQCLPASALLERWPGGQQLGAERFQCVGG